MSNTSISCGNGGRCVRLTTLPPSCAVVMKSVNLNLLEHSGHCRSVTGLLYLYILAIHKGRPRNDITCTLRTILTSLHLCLVSQLAFFLHGFLLKFNTKILTYATNFSWPPHPNTPNFILLKICWWSVQSKWNTSLCNFLRPLSFLFLRLMNLTTHKYQINIIL